MRRSEVLVLLTAAALCATGLAMFFLSLHRAAR